MASYVALLAALLFLPGLLVGAALRVRGWLLAGLAPLLSLAVIGVGAIAAQGLGVGFSPLWVGGCTAVVALASWRATYVLRRRYPEWFCAPEARSSTATAVRPRRSLRPLLDLAWPLGAWAGAALLNVRALRRIIPRPDRIANGVDNLYHLNAVQWVVQHHDASSFTMDQMVRPANPEFYPAAWHGWVGLALMLRPSDNVAAAVNAAVFVTVGLVWPLTLVVLTRALLPRSRAALAFVPAFSFCFPGFPFKLVAWGPIYPNVLGLVLVPALVAAIADGLRLARGRRHAVAPTLAAAALGCVGLAITHPGALMTLVVFLVPMALAWLWQQSERRRAGSLTPRAWRASIALTAFALVAMAVAWVALRPSLEATPWDAYGRGDYGRAVGLVVTMMCVQPYGLALGVAATTILGAYVALHTGYLRWLVATHAAFALIFVFTYTHGRSAKRFLVSGAWYSDASRVGPMLVLSAIGLSLLGIWWLTQVASARLAALPSRGAWRWLRDPLVGIVAWALVVAAFTITGMHGTGMRGQLYQAVVFYSPDASTEDAAALVDTDELEMFRRIDAMVPRDQTIATNPLNGSSLAYGTTGRPTTTTHAFYPPTPAQALISDHLREASADPDRICPAVRELKVHWALDFGPRTVFSTTDDPSLYPGLRGLDAAPGFTPVLRVGDKALYRVDACWA